MARQKAIGCRTEAPQTALRSARAISQAGIVADTPSLPSQAFSEACSAAREARWRLRSSSAVATSHRKNSRRAFSRHRASWSCARRLIAGDPAWGRFRRQRTAPGHPYRMTGAEPEHSGYRQSSRPSRGPACRRSSGHKRIPRSLLACSHDATLTWHRAIMICMYRSRMPACLHGSTGT